MGDRDYTVNMKELMEWANRNNPMAVEKLAVAALVSVKTTMAMFNGNAPRLPRTRLQLARAMGKPTEVLFKPKVKPAA